MPVSVGVEVPGQCIGNADLVGLVGLVDLVDLAVAIVVPFVANLRGSGSYIAVFIVAIVARVRKSIGLSTRNDRRSRVSVTIFICVSKPGRSTVCIALVNVSVAVVVSLVTELRRSRSDLGNRIIAIVIQQDVTWKVPTGLECLVRVAVSVAVTVQVPDSGALREPRNAIAKDEVTRRIRSGKGKGHKGRRSSPVEKSNQIDPIDNREQTVVIGVDRVQAVRGELSKDQEEENAHGIRQVYFLIPVQITADEILRSLGDFQTEQQSVQAASVRFARPGSVCRSAQVDGQIRRRDR